MLPPFHITGASVLRPGGIGPGPLGLAEGRVAEGPVGRAVHLPGCLVLPGIVDIHGDGFERHLAPRRGAVGDPAEGLVALEAELAANGITTAVLAQFWSWEGGMRGPDFALSMLAALEAVRPDFATTLVPQLRVETHLIEDYPRIEAAVTRFGVPYVVFNDHLPHDALNRGRKVPRLTGQALKSGRSPAAHLELIERLHALGPKVPDAVASLAGRLAAQGVLLGSHDDPDAGARMAWRDRGVRISEFPETRPAVEAASAAGEPVIMGAPNVMRGGSHAGKIAAGEVVRAGQCRALASDYHYPAPRRAALSLAKEIGLAEAWALISARPAEILGLSDRGRLEAGRRADLLVLEEATGRVMATIAGGEMRYCAGPAASAFMA